MEGVRFLATIFTTAGAIAAGFAILAGLLALAKLWHQPRFVAGILPTHVRNPESLFKRTGRGTAQRKRYKQKELSQDRVYDTSADGTVLLAALIQNQGRGRAESVTVNLELDTDAVEILDICTEAMKVNAIFGNANNIAAKLQDVVANRRIRDAYSHMGPSGTYIQFVSPFPSTAVEVFVVELKATSPIDLSATIRIQTPSRIMQQNAIQQKVAIKAVHTSDTNER